MISLLESRNVIVNDKPFAEMALQNFSYYGLVNGYKNTFIQQGDCDKFIPGTTFNEIYTLHILDMTLSNILFKNILIIEKSLKSRLSYLIADNYDVYTDINNTSTPNPSDYLDPSHYSNAQNRRINTIKALKESLVYNKNHSDIVEHYKSHENHIPPWILTTNIPYGLAIEWYRILVPADKTSLCTSFISPGLLNMDEIKEFVVKAFDLTKEYRNKIAHGNRVFNILSPLPVLPKKQILALSFGILSEAEYLSGLGQSDIYAILLAVMIFVDDTYIINNLLTDLETFFKLYGELTLSNKSIYEILGLPEDILDRLKKLYQRKFSIIVT